LERLERQFHDQVGVDDPNQAADLTYGGLDMTGGERVPGSVTAPVNIDAVPRVWRAARQRRRWSAYSFRPWFPLPGTGGLDTADNRHHRAAPAGQRGRDFPPAHHRHGLRKPPRKRSKRRPEAVQKHDLDETQKEAEEGGRNLSQIRPGLGSTWVGCMNQRKHYTEAADAYRHLGRGRRQVSVPV